MIRSQYIIIVILLVASVSLTGQNHQFVEVIELDSTIQLDLRYATANNFVEEVLYDCPRCFLHQEAATALVKAHQELMKIGFGLKLFDCYRPGSVQQRLWEILPNASYVTPPKKGSMHNRGLAVDVTIVDSNGVELNMGTDFDFFGRRAHTDHTDLPTEVLCHREQLKSVMTKYGFRGIRTEWWHYSYFISGQEVSQWTWSCDVDEQP